MTDQSWEQIISKELTQAQTARDSENEGMARVCSRRAAAIAIGKFLSENDLPDSGSSAIERLKCLHAISGVSTEAKQAAKLLLLRVDTNHNLPIEADLITEAYKLIVSLFPEFHWLKE